MLREEIKQVESIAQTAANAVAKILVQEIAALKGKITALESDIAKLKTAKTEKTKDSQK